jgi:predicted permease
MLRPLVAVQAGFSVVVLFVAGLLLLSFGRLTSLDPGFAPSGLLLLSVGSREPLPPEAARVAGLQLIDHVRRVPGVDGASLSGWALFSSSSWTASIRLPDRPKEAFDAHLLRVSPGFFHTMRVRLVDGREFVPRDTEPETPAAAIVNEAFATRYFGERRAVGRILERIAERGTVRQEIVGVVANVKYSNLRPPPPPTIYVPHRDLRTLQVRTVGDPIALVPLLRREVQAVHPSLQVTDVQLQSALIDITLLRERLLALLSGFFGLVGLLLASVGLYGVLSYSIVQRTREIGIRVALGARQLAIVGSVLRDAGVMAVLGAAGGLVGGVYLARFVRTLLYEVQPLDFVSVALPIGCLLVAGTIAAVLPARRAARVDPVVALRYD